MRAFVLRESCQAAAIELDAIAIGCDRTVLSRGEVDVTVIFIHAFDRTYFPLSVCDLFQQLSVLRVVIKMFPAVAFAGPDKRTVVQPDRLLVNGDPRFRGFVNDGARLA